MRFKLGGYNTNAHCTNCNHYVLKEGGKWRYINNGKNKKWLCKPCAEKFTSEGMKLHNE